MSEAPGRSCGDCGSPTDRLKRGRCHRCYQRHVYALKKSGDFQRVTAAPPLQRFLASRKDSDNGCILWTGAVNHVTGYGSLSVNGITEYAHRFAYTTFVGPIPEGMHVDHVCHNQDMTCIDESTCLHRRCVNPSHLEAVPPKDNILRSHLSTAGKNLRKTHCKRGHQFTPENTLPRGNGGRECRACHNLRQRECGAKRRAAKRAAAYEVRRPADLAGRLTDR